MSAFLGPIHFWLYNKIKLQNELVENIIEKFDISMEKEFDEEFSGLEKGDLAEIIDDSNIHGWLQERIKRLEYRLAYVVKKLTDSEPDNLKEIENIAFSLGQKYTDKIDTASEAYRLLENTLLNGMPCDRVNSVLEENDNNVIWEQTVDIHRRYWDELKADVRQYYIIRKALVDGVLYDTDFSYNAIDTDRFEIRRK